MTSGTAFALGAVGGALAGRAYKRGIAPMLIGGAAGSFAMVQLTQPKAPPSGVIAAGAPSGGGLSTGTGALIALGVIGVLVLMGEKKLRRLGG